MTTGNFFLIFDYFPLPKFQFFSYPKKRKKVEKKEFAAARVAIILATRWTGNTFFFKGGLSSVDLKVNQGPHCTGKTGKITKIIPCQGKHREYVNFVKTRGILFAQSCKSLILKVKNIAILAAIA